MSEVIREWDNEAQNKGDDAIQEFRKWPIPICYSNSSAQMLNVIAEIEETLPFRITIEGRECWIQWRGADCEEYDTAKWPAEGIGTTANHKLGAMFIAVVMFIEWCNANKKTI